MLFLEHISKTNSSIFQVVETERVEAIFLGLKYGDVGLRYGDFGIEVRRLGLRYGGFGIEVRSRFRAGESGGKSGWARGGAIRFPAF